MENRYDPLCTEVDPAALVLDLRPAEQFARGQIPGAVHLDLWGLSLIDTSEAPLRAFMWMIGHLFSLRGVTPDRPVVVYEHDSGVRAARAFWFLEYLGHPHVRLLDGGLAAYERRGLPISHAPTAPVPSDWHGTLVPERGAAWTDILARLGSTETVLVDTRSRDEHTGALLRARRGGTIPGSVHLEWKDNLTPDGTFKSPDTLRTLYAAAGITPDREVVAYCQGGYRGAHSYVAMRAAGFPHVRNYLGSWKEWGDREDLPLERPSPSA